MKKKSKVEKCELMDVRAARKLSQKVVPGDWKVVALDEVQVLVRDAIWGGRSCIYWYGDVRDGGGNNVALGSGQVDIVLGEISKRGYSVEGKGMSITTGRDYYRVSGW